MFWKIYRVFNYKSKFNHVRNCSSDLKPPWRILFFGNDSFSLYSLQVLADFKKRKLLVKDLEVVTSVKSLKKNIIENFAIRENIRSYEWPVHSLQSGDFDLGIIVSFGKLIPENIITKFPLGILNIHASLLPKWRGAAPIVHAIANGERITGVTIMRIKPDYFDVGDILYQKEIAIGDRETASELHVKLGHIGAEALAEVLSNLPKYLKSARPQSNKDATYAPKVSASMSHIIWETMTAEKICNISRALSNFYDLIAMWNGTPVKLLDIAGCASGPSSSSPSDNFSTGSVIYDKNVGKLLVKCADGKWISVGRVKVTGHKIMKAVDFKNGFISKQTEKNRKFDSYYESKPSLK